MKYNPPPIFAGLLAATVIVSLATLPFVRFWKDGDLKRKACLFYADFAFFAGLYEIIGLLYAAFAAVIEIRRFRQIRETTFVD